MSPPSPPSTTITTLTTFNCIIDPEGNLVRLTKGRSSKSNYSSPPTPQEASLRPDLPLEPPSPDLHKILPGPNRAGRIMKSASTSKYCSSAVHPSGFGGISERETSGSEQADYYTPV